MPSLDKLRSLVKRFNLSDQYGTTGEEKWIALFRTLTANRTPLSGRINDEYRTKIFAHIDVTASQDDGAKKKISEADWAKVSSLLKNIVDGKVFYITEHGYLGFAEESCQKGDDVYVFCGGEVPFIVRLIGEGLFAFHGETYVHGLMDGEVMQWKNLKLERLNLK